MVYDCGGYASKANLKCSDGRTILPNAFAQQSGQTVPLVWQHQRNDPNNVLGHALLENRADGVYCYCKFNDSKNGQQVKHLVEHGDVCSLSIFANELKEQAKRVSHGVIREVSVVLAGANPGACIDNVVLQHSDGSQDELETDAVIYTGLEIDHSVTYDEDENDDDLEHADEDDDIPTAKKIWNGMTEEQKNLTYALITHAVEEFESDGDEDEEDDADEANHSDEGGEEMKVNVFEGTQGVSAPSLTHDDFKNIIEDAKRGGSLKVAFGDYLEHMLDTGRLVGVDKDSLQHGIEDLEILFPEAKAVTPTPEMIMRQQDWVPVVWNGTKKAPFSRVKTVFADITREEARARGYIKGNKKVEEQFGLLKRVTTPQTVVKLQKMDRDDIIDITDFDVIAWLKAEMRLMLNEELSRAVIIGDGRQSGDNDKINESNIRPVWKDEDLFTIKATISAEDYASAEGNLGKTDLIIDTVAQAMDDYEGSGSPTAFVAPGFVTMFKMARDKIGRRLYNTDAEIASALGVSKIVPVPVMKKQVREGRTDDVHKAKEEGKYFQLMALIVNLSDYTIGADRGGAVSLFDDFDIDYNKYSYLIETRCSGALTKPNSAIAVELEVKPYSPVVAIDPPTQSRMSKTVSELQKNIKLHTNTFYGTLLNVTDAWEDFSSDPAINKGHFLSLALTKPTGAEGTDKVFTKIINGRTKEWKEVNDGFCVYRIADPKKQRIAVEYRNNSGEVLDSKEYSLNGLTLEE